MNKPLQAVLDLLDLEPIEVNLFRGQSPKEERQRVFGGQVLAQALVAADRTVEDRLAHSFHAYFLRPGDPAVPILYDVDRIRDGKSFTTRRVKAIQHGRAIFNMSVSFQVVEAGLEHQMPMPAAPSPDDLPTMKQQEAVLIESASPEFKSWFGREHAFEERVVEPINWFAPQKRDPHQQVWIRTNGKLPDEPALHQALLAYLSDMSLLDTSSMPHGVSYFDSGMQIASLDHAMWFHRPFRTDDWLLYETDSPSTSNARGFNRGTLYARDGTLVASVVQEGLIRQAPANRVKA
ncbi:MAG: acyl-CoA thioesterase II [Myxococcota bacterium]